MSVPLSGLRLHHVGILVADLDLALPLYVGPLGFAHAAPHEAPAHDIRAALIDVGGSYLELFAPLSADGRIAATLAKRGPGVHHLCYQVPDIVAALARCREAGIALIDSVPRPGLHDGWQVAFLHPRSCGGVLTELVEISG